MGCGSLVMIGAIMAASVAAMDLSTGWVTVCIHPA